MKLLLALALLAAPAPAVKLPTMQSLVEAARTGDDVELERLGRRLGAPRLLKAAAAGPKAERLAALRALPLTDGAWAELSSLAPLLADGDGEVAEAAARAAQRIAQAMTRDTAFAEEIPPDVPREAARALWSAAGEKAALPSVRASAIAAAASLGRQLAAPPLDGAALDALLTDGDPQVRRAAVEALDARKEAARLARALGDPDDAVAAAAGASACAGVPPVRAPSEKPLAVDEAGRARIRVLVLDEKLQLADRLDLIPCLRAFATLADRKLLDDLAKSDVESIKRRARSYGGR